ncbi:sensor histidine kinase [Brevibacillus daliensis]|uniref:sensor histidine kinase n=1 Tax=Brevibacillus daliensis TaxID=2892995 RepID=UPI001E3D1181|nr:sensor histidine kinase [Brevibacillus daliensis]
MDSQIRHLCRLHTELSDTEVDRIVEVAESFETSDGDYDVFIDVLSKYDNEAIVVYHRRPDGGRSMYKHSLVSDKALRENEPGVLRTLETGIMSRGLVAYTTQADHLLRQTVYPIEHNDRVICVVIYERNVSEEIQSHFDGTTSPYQGDEIPINLSALLRFKETVINQLDDAILFFDDDGFVKLKNSQADIYYQRFGYRENIQGLHYDNLSHDRTSFSQLMKGENVSLHMSKEMLIGGRYYRVKRFLINEREFRLVLILQDITEIKRKEAEIVSKSVAIREIHHRVKNNLQTVASVLRIQSRQVKSAEAKKSLNESVSRVLAIAATHELLSMEMEAKVKLLEVTRIIGANIQRCFVNGNNIQVKMTENQPIYLDSDRTVAIALIINELIQNSYEHAFDNRLDGNINVSLMLENGYVTIDVADDGQGFTARNNSCNSLGLSIVNSYVKDKLKGKLKIDSNSSGTIAKFTFKL